MVVIKGVLINQAANSPQPILYSKREFSCSWRTSAVSEPRLGQALTTRKYVEQNATGYFIGKLKCLKYQVHGSQRGGLTSAWGGSFLTSQP